MDIKSAYVAFALGVAVGIVSAVALSDPRLTAGFLAVSLLIIGVSAIASLRNARRRRDGRSLLVAQANSGQDLRQRIFEAAELPTPEEDKARWWKEFNDWDQATHKVIHEHADHLHSKYNTWPVPMGAYMRLKLWRSEVVNTLDARLQALAEIQARF